MDPSNAIEIRNISKSFIIQQIDGSKKNVIGKPTIRKKKNKVLDNLTIDIKKGDVLGILGRNGSGKSTFLSILARIMEPDTGIINRSGKIAAILELGMGFHPDMTGRENIYTKGELYGFSKKDMDGKIEKIIDYSGIRKYIDNPVRTYSSGMSGRLAFAIMVNVESDIILVDEVLSVGDSSFSAKAKQHFIEMAENKKTVLIVSHNLGYIEEVCNRAIWIENGKIVMDSDPETVCAEYHNRINEDPEIICDLAHSGVPDAQYKLSLMYRDGIHYQKDQQEYENWLRSAADRRSIRAQILYGDMLMSRGQNEKALNYYRSAAEKGDWEARIKVASLSSSKPDNVQALIGIYQNSLIKNNGLMEYRYAELLLKISWSDDDRKKSFDMFVQSANDGYVDALHQIAIMYRDGIGTAKNYDLMIKYLTQSANHGAMRSITLLADINIQGKMIPKNRESAFYWTLKAAELGNRDFMYRVAVMYRDGVGTEKNKTQSDYWFGKYEESYLYQQYYWAINYEKSRDDDLDPLYGMMESSMNSGTLHQYMMHTKDSEKRLEILQKLELLAKSGNQDAINKLGNMYYDGIIVDADPQKALFWYECGARYGNSWSQTKAGEMYRDGNGIDTNKSLAIQYFKSAAMSGNIRSIDNLIRISYIDREHNNDDYEWAMKLIKNHAEGGNIDAINRLGNMYLKGFCVDADEEASLYWYAKGASLGDITSKRKRDEILTRNQRNLQDETHH